MRLLTQSELDRRFRDILLNILRLAADAKIGVYPISDGAPMWWEKFTHVLEEMQLRHGPYPAGFRREMHSPQNEPFPNFVSDLAKKAAAKMASQNLKRGDVFIKFGKREHMEALYEAGALRIQPASFFLNKSHNPAIRDDELSLDFSFALSRDEIVKLVKNPEDVGQNIRDQRMDVSLRCPTDYWLYCLTNSIEPRLFVDFNSDACVIIHDREAFGEMLGVASALNSSLLNTTMRNGNALYIDPFFPSKEVVSPNMFIPLAKHFGYTYQDEYRFCWLPNTNQKKLSPVDLSFGSLSKVAELIVL